MRDHVKTLALAVSAALLLSGCNTDTSADKPAETSAVTEEVTTEDNIGYNGCKDNYNSRNRTGTA